jgi:hypothetical protein
MSSKLERSHETPSARLEEWKDEDLDDFESVSSGGEPGESRPGDSREIVVTVGMGIIRERSRGCLSWRATAAAEVAAAAAALVGVSEVVAGTQLMIELVVVVVAVVVDGNGIGINSTEPWRLETAVMDG